MLHVQSKTHQVIINSCQDRRQVEEQFHSWEIKIDSDGLAVMRGQINYAIFTLLSLKSDRSCPEQSCNTVIIWKAIGIGKLFEGNSFWTQPTSFIDVAIHVLFTRNSLVAKIV